MRRTVAALAGVLVLLLVSACGPHSSVTSGVNESDVAVDTPALAAQKKAAGIETCKPGKSSTPALPNLTLPCLGGGPSVDLDSLQGPLVINLWASNCGPCRKELPALQAFSEQYGAKVPVLGIDWLDTYPGAALDLLQQSGVTYPQLADPGGTLLDQRDLKLKQASPQFIFVRPDGSIDYAAGGLGSEDEVKQLVEEKLGVTL